MVLLPCLASLGTPIGYGRLMCLVGLADDVFCGGGLEDSPSAIRPVNANSLEIVRRMDNSNCDEVLVTSYLGPLLISTLCPQWLTPT